MIIKLGPLATAVAGSIEGTTFQRSPLGTIVRAKPLPTYRGTPYAAGARQRVATANQMWAAMSLSDRADWQTFSETITFYNRFGDVIPSRGYLAFSRANFGHYASVALWPSVAFQATPPPDTASTLPTNPLLLLESGGLDMALTADDVTVPADSRWAIFATRPRKPIIPPDKPTVQDGMLVGFVGGGDPLPIDLTANYTACFGRLPVPNNGENCAIRVLALNRSYYWPGLSAYMTATPI